jgi:hypothetical protein
MEFDPLPLSLPAIVALAIKVVIFFYARQSPTHNKKTQLFLGGVFALAIQDIAEIAHFYLLAMGYWPTFEFRLFYAAGIVALAIMFNLALCVAVEDIWPRASNRLAWVWYCYATVLIIQLFTGTNLITGFERIGNCMTRIPGPAYVAFELYAIGGCLMILTLFSYGTMRQDTGAKRSRNALLLVATLPSVILITTLFGLLRFDVKWTNATVVLPLAVTVFLVVSAYAIYQHRIFDIQLFIPWSPARRRKTAFHRRVRQLISEIAELPSANQIVRRLSDTLNCPVVLLGPNRVVYAGEPAQEMSQFSPQELGDIDHIVVANEIVESRPQVYQHMKQHGVAAIVPFYPHSESVSGWLLLGDNFNEQVHSPLDFRLVEELFGKMSELFLDRFVTLRSELRSANRQINSLTLRNQSLEEKAEALQREIRALRSSQESLVRTDGAQDLDQLLQVADSRLAMSLTYVGRDKEMLKDLRGHFRVVKSFVSLRSKALRKAGNPELLVCHITDDEAELHKYLSTLDSPFACLLYGPGVERFAQAQRQGCGGNIIDAVFGPVSSDLIHTRIESLMYLRRHTHWVREGGQPLIGLSPAFDVFLQKLRTYAGFDDAVLLFYDDHELASTAAAYLHGFGERRGEIREVAPEEVRSCDAESDHTLVLLDAGALDPAAQARLAEAMVANRGPSTRLVLGCRYDQAEALGAELKALTQGFEVNVPRLHERRDDIPLLVHYYTLEFNLKSGALRSLSRAEVRSLKLHEPSWTLDGLRRATVEFLATKSKGVVREIPDFSTAHSIELANRERSLDELVADFESGIIQQTLERCDGNKAKAARLLGLRPNTLHYKLERYGLNRSSRPRRGKSQGGR